MLKCMRIEPIVAPEQLMKGILLLTTISSTIESQPVGHMADLLGRAVQHLDARGLPQEETFQDQLEAARRGANGNFVSIRDTLGDAVADDISLLRSGLIESIELASADKIDDADAAMKRAFELVPALETHFFAALNRRRSGVLG